MSTEAIASSAIPLRAVSSAPVRPRVSKLIGYVQKGERRLTLRQYLFINYYLGGMTASGAARTAGYKGGIVKQASAIFLENPRIVAEINRRTSKKFKQYEITAEKVINEACKLGFANMLDYLEIDKETGKTSINMANVDRDQGAAIQEFYQDRDGNIRIKMVDKKASLELLARFLKMLNEKVDNTPGEGKPLNVQTLDAMIVKQLTINQQINIQSPTGQEMSKTIEAAKTQFLPACATESSAG